MSARRAERRRSSRVRRIRPALLLRTGLLGCALAAVPAGAEVASPATPEPDHATAIPLEEVADESLSVTQRLRSFEPAPRAVELVAEAEANRDRLVREIRPRLERSRAALASRATVDVLRRLRSELAALGRRLAADEAVLDDQAEQRAGALRELEVIRSRWAATKAAADRATASEPVLRRIDATLAAIETGLGRLRARRDEILTLLGRFVDERQTVESALQSVDGEIGARLGQLLWADRAPLWSADLRAQLRKGLREQPIRAELHELAAYLRSRAATLAMQLAAVVGAALLLRWLGSRLRARLSRYPDFAGVQRVWDLPFSMALILTVTTSELLYGFHPLAPPLYAVLLVGLLVVVPVARISVRTLPRPLEVAVYGLVALFVLDRIHLLLAPVEPLARGSHVLELAAATGFAAWFQRTRASRALGQPQVALARAGFRAAIPLLLLALVAELAGWSQLAVLVGGGTLHAGMRTLVIYAVFQALWGLVAYALTSSVCERLNMVRQHRRLVGERLAAILRSLAILLWVFAVFDAYGLSGSMLALLRALLAAGVSVGALSVTLGDFAAFGLTLAAAFWLARLVEFALGEEVYPRVRLARGMPYALSALARYSLLSIGLLFALAAAGIELGRLAILAGGLGVGIGFGLQNVTNNFISGLILLFERPVQVGDMVELPSLVGSIRHIGIRATVIATLDGAEVIVPNGQLVSEIVTNWTLSHPHRRIDLAVGVAYGTDAQRVIDLLLDVARSCDEALDEPAPQAFFVGFGDSALEFLVRVWSRRYELEPAVRSKLALGVQRALDRAGISVPFPQRDLHLRSVASDVRDPRAGPDADETPPSGPTTP